MTDTGAGYVSWLFLPGSREVGGRLFYQGDRVTLVRFLVEGTLSFGELSEDLGPPDFVSAIVGMADSQWLMVTIIYAQKGVAARHFDAAVGTLADSVEIGRDMVVVEFSYFDPESLEALLVDGMLIKEPYDLIRQSLTTWRGFSAVPFVEEYPEQ